MEKSRNSQTFGASGVLAGGIYFSRPGAKAQDCRRVFWGESTAPASAQGLMEREKHPREPLNWNFSQRGGNEKGKPGSRMNTLSLGEPSTASRASPVHETPFRLSRGKETPYSHTYVSGPVVTSAASTCGPGIFCRFRQAAPNRPRFRFGSGRPLPGVEAGPLEVQSGGRPYPGCTALRPSTPTLPVLRLNVLAIILITTIREESRGRGFFCKYILRGEEGR